MKKRTFLKPKKGVSRKSSSPLNDNTQKPSWMGQKSVNGKGDTRKSTASPKKPIVQKSISRKSSSPLNDSYIKQEEKMIKRNQKRGNKYQQASAGSKTQRIQNAVGAAKVQNAINKSKQTINMLKDINSKRSNNIS